MNAEHADKIFPFIFPPPFPTGDKRNVFGTRYGKGGEFQGMSMATMMAIMKMEIEDCGLGMKIKIKMPLHWGFLNLPRTLGRPSIHIFFFLLI